MSRQLILSKKLRVGLLDCGCDPEDPDNLIYFETLQQEP
jgi:hypothetical protein